MKKFLCFIFILMLSLLLTACQNKKYNEPKDNTKFKNYLTDTLNTIDEKKVDERFDKVKSPSKYLEEIKFKNTKITNTYKSDRYGTSSDTIYLWEEDEEYFMYYESMGQLQSFSLSDLDSYIDEDYVGLKVSKAINKLLSDAGLDMELDDFFDCVEFSIDDFEETKEKDVYKLKNDVIAEFVSNVSKKAGFKIKASEVEDVLDEFKKFECLVTYGNGKIRTLSFNIDYKEADTRISGTLGISFLYDQEVGICGLRFDTDIKISGIQTGASSEAFYIYGADMEEYIENGWCEYDFNEGPSSFRILDVNNCPISSVYDQEYHKTADVYKLKVEKKRISDPKDVAINGYYTVSTTSVEFDATVSGSLVENVTGDFDKITAKLVLNSESLTSDVMIYDGKEKNNILNASIKLKDNYLNSGKVVITDPDSGDTQTYEITTGSKVEIPDKDTISGESLVKSTWKFYRAESGDDNSWYEYSLGDYQDGIYITEDYMTITCNPDGTGKIIVDMGDDSQNIDITWSGSNNNYKFYFNGYTYDVRVHGNELEMSIHEGEFYQLFVLHKQ